MKKHGSFQTKVLSAILPDIRAKALFLLSDIQKDRKRHPQEEEAQCPAEDGKERSCGSAIKESCCHEKEEQEEAFIHTKTLRKAGKKRRKGKKGSRPVPLSLSGIDKGGKEA